MVISQDKLEKGMKQLVKKLNIRFENEKGLDDIKWLSDEFVLETSEETNPVTIVVQGTLEFVKEINQYIEDKIAPLYDDLKIINCYEVYNTNTMLYNILDEHDYVFNTAGFNDKTDIFPGYIDKKKATNNFLSVAFFLNYLSAENYFSALLAMYIILSAEQRLSSCLISVTIPILTSSSVLRTVVMN